MSNRQLLRRVAASIILAASFLPSPMTQAQTIAASQAPLNIAVPDEAAFFAALDLERPDMAEVKTAAVARDWTAAKAAWARHLETRTSPKWLWSRRDKDQIVKLLDARDGGLKRFIKPADTVLLRQFNPQGIPYQLKKDIDWILPNSEETHVLSRFAYWRDMGLAYWQTGDAKYPTDFVTIMNDWLADNPVPHDLSAVTRPGTTWRSLEAGIRATNWWDDMELFMDAPQFDAQAKYQMSKSLMEHARYLYEWTPKFRGGNWQVSEAGGLATTGILFPEAKESGQWRERGLLRLTDHMEKDVLPDGGHSELTPGYHEWVMSQITSVAQLCQLNGISAPGLTERHEKMFEWLLKLSRPDRRVPSLGDTHSPMKIDADMATGALLYGRSDMRYLGAKEGPASWVWLFGAGAFERYEKVPSKTPAFTSTLLPDSQYMVMRTGWEANDKALLFDCAPWGGGHSHQDALQVLLFDGRDLLIDSGIYSYNQPLSTTYFRTSGAHNVVTIDDQPVQNPKDPKSNPQLLAWQTTDLADFASGSITNNGITHQRSVLFVKPDYWVVVDQISGAGQHEVKRLFHLPRGETKVEENVASTAFPSGTNLQIQVADDARLEMGLGWVPTEGAKAEPSPVATYVSKGALPMTLITVLTPFTDAKALPKLETIQSDDRMARLRLHFADGQRDEIAVAATSTHLPNGERGRALVLRKGPQSNDMIVLNSSLGAAQ